MMMMMMMMRRRRRRRKTQNYLEVNVLVSPGVKYH